MTKSYLKRYQEGEHEQVWRELDFALLPIKEQFDAVKLAGGNNRAELKEIAAEMAPLHKLIDKEKSNWYWLESERREAQKLLDKVKD